MTMPGDARSHLESARLDLGGRRTEFLLIGGLAVVIIGAIVLTVLHSMDVRIGGGSPKPMAECQSCQERFELDPSEDPRALIGSMGPGSKIYQPDCTKCGKKESGLPLMLCPNPECGKHFLSPHIANRLKIRDGADPSTLKQSKVICPHCGTDHDEWQREQFRKEHGTRGKKK